MKIHKIFAAAFAVALAFSLYPAHAPAQEKADLTPLLGTWEITMDRPNGSVTRIWVFSLKDDKLTATLQGGGRRPGGMRSGRGMRSTSRGGSRSTNVSDISFDGTTVRFSLTRNTPRGDVTLTYSAQLTGKTMEGTMAFGDRGEMAFTGTKKKE